MGTKNSCSPDHFCRKDTAIHAFVGEFGFLDIPEGTVTLNKILNRSFSGNIEFRK